jgi:hypothetical protein
MLENNIVAASLSQNGNSLRDFGGQLLYLNQGHRWNFLAGYVHAPFITGGLIFGDTTLTDNAGNQVPGQFEAQVLQRTYLDQVAVGTQYPLSQTHRFEFNLSANHIGYNIEEDRLTAVGGQIIDESVVQLPHPPGLTYYQGTAAFVGDYSYFGFTSPIAGARYRLEVDPTFGSLSYEGVLADLRRYFFLRPVSFAFRAVHYGRYGSGSDDPRLYPIYLGDEQLVRGYSTGSINIGECGAQVNINGTCPVFDRLVGSRIAVANAELRIPLFGTEQLGLINFPYLPTEIAPFFDAGVAWTSTQSPTIEFARNTDKRVPVFSTGVSARVNLLGYAVLEVYWAKPFQRPGRSSVWGFQVAPGW